jgi:DnaJ homolog subfamily A member 5
VSQDAEYSEIRSSYRKLALRWHPDKNMDNLEEATLRFREIQNSWEVLSDDQERAWYDGHRQEILRSGEVGASSSSSPGPAEEPEDIATLWSFFSSTKYDSEESFYKVYGDVFAGIGRKEEKEYPDMGGVSTPFENVGRFYASWKNFVTNRDFSWADIHRIRDAPNRFIRREMEKENTKARDKARKKYVQCVRELANFVSKRDPRVVLRKKELEKEKAEKEKLQEEEKRAKKEEKEKIRKEREARVRRGEATWMSSDIEARDRELQEHFEAIGVGNGKKKNKKNKKKTGMSGGMSAGLGGGSGSLQEYYCAACGKSFRTESQWRNHEQSKKHQKAIQQWAMSIDMASETEETTKSKKDRKREAKKEKDRRDREMEDDDDDDGEDEDVKPIDKEEEDDGEEEEEDDDLDYLAAFVSHKKASRGGYHHHHQSRVVVDKIHKEEEKEDHHVGENDDDDDDDDDKGTTQDAKDTKGGGVVDDDGEKKITKRKRRRKQKGDETTTVILASPSTSTGARDGDGDGDGDAGRRKGKKGKGSSFKCRSCSKTFASKTQLFKHLKETGHANATG